MITVKEAQRKIFLSKINLKSEIIRLDNALGRVNYRDIKSKINNPSNNLSSMDGYALRYLDAISLNKYPIQIIGESAAGNPFNDLVMKNECIKISTGGIVPENLDCILLKENVSIKNKNIISSIQNIKKNEYIRKKGKNFSKNTLLLKKNTVINARSLGIIAASNNANIKVYKKPIISVLSTGSELTKIGKPLKNYEIISSNSFLLQSLIQCMGAKYKNLGIAKDNEQELSKKILASKKSDILITTGGISVGDHDLVKSVLKKLGFNIVFWKVAMRPGKPILFAKHKNMIVLCFPGNPVSTFVASIIFLLPLIQKLFNLNYKLPIKTALLAKDLRKNDNREDYIRAKIKYLKNNQIIAEPFQKQDSSMTLILNKSEGLIIRKPFAKSVKAGSSVSVIPFSSINTII